MRARIPDPNDPATFAASVPDRAEAGTAPHADVLALHRTLLALRARHVVPGIPGCRSLGAAAVGERAVQAAWRLGTGETLILQSNFGPAPVRIPPGAGVLLFASTADAEAELLPALCTRAFLEAAS